MLKRSQYYWRLFATAVSFSLFGLGGLVLRLLLLPLLTLFVWRTATRIYYARTLIRYSFRVFIALMRGLGVLTYDIHGLARLQRSGLLIVANHPTLIDTVFLMAFVKQADCIVNQHLWQNPFTSGPIRAAGYIGNQHGPDLLKACERSLARGDNLLIFPEGTRTPHDGTLHFKRGAATLAIRGGHNMTPVIIRCRPATLSKGEKWWQIPAATPHFSLTVGHDIVVQAYGTDSSEALASRRLTRDLELLFSRNH